VTDWTSAYARLHAAGEAAFPPACLYYVLECVRRAARTKGASLTPAEIVMSFRTGARTDFGPLLPEVLADWGLESPGDLGRAVLLLGRTGALSLSPSDTPEAFAEDTRPLAAEPGEVA
jgi:uncharacterized repeat protein (TIGR04138 family)